MSVKSRIQKLESRCFTEREQTFEAFFKEFFSWSADNVGVWIGAGFFIFFQGVLMWIPYQGMDDMLGVVWMFALWGSMLYIRPYLQFREGNKDTRICDKLQYLPISLKELQIYRTKKLGIFCFKLFLVFLAGQLFFSLVAYHEITWANILYVLILGFLLPFAIGAVATRFTR